MAIDVTGKHLFALTVINSKESVQVHLSSTERLELTFFVPIRVSNLFEPCFRLMIWHRKAECFVKFYGHIIGSENLNKCITKN